MLITLITGNKGKESKIEINILSKFLCTYHRPVGMDVNTTRHYTFIYTLMHSSVVYESIETPVPPSPGLCRGFNGTLPGKHKDLTNINVFIAGVLTLTK